MNSGRAGGYCYVSAGIDEQVSGQLPVVSGPSACLPNDGYSLAGERFQIAGGEIFFAELDVVDSGAGGFSDFIEETATAGRFVGCECGAVGDVVKNTAFSHQVSAISDAPINLVVWTAYMHSFSRLISRSLAPSRSAKACEANTFTTVALCSPLEINRSNLTIAYT
jgi:hypothetical protein